MKPARYFFVAMVLFAAASPPVLADAKLPESDPQPLLISKSDPVLAGIEPLCIVVLHSDAGLKKSDLLWKNLQRKAESDLKKAGIDVIAIQDGNYPPEIPELRVAIDMMRYENSTRYFLHIQTSLARIAYIERNGTVSMKTDVWRIGPAMEISSAENMQTVINRVVSQQVEVFINACIVSNPKNKIAESNSVSVSPKNSEGEKSSPAKYAYITSKNSKTFHKADCPLAARIKPENLVGYSSRQEALDAGKKPCKICRP